MKGVLIIEVEVSDNLTNAIVQMSRISGVVKDVATPEMNKDGMYCAFAEDAEKVMNVMTERE